MTVPIQQGTLNRLRSSVVFANFPELTIQASNLTKEGISISFEGAASQNLPTMTGMVGSPEPYQQANITIHAVRSQALADSFKQQIETDTQMGSVNVIADTTTLSDYQIESCVITNVDPMAFDGNQPAFVVHLSGVYYANAALWAAN